MKGITEIFCDIDDFCKKFVPVWESQQLASGERRRLKKSGLCLSEIMTIMVLFHRSHFRDMKAFYTTYVKAHLSGMFPGLVSYGRFVELQQGALIPLCGYFHQRRGKCSKISYIDSTALAVCHNRRIQRNRVFHGVAARGKTSMGWFYGFKLHLVVNHYGEVLSCCVTPGNIDDRQPVGKLTRGLEGKLFGDRGYLSKKLFQQLFSQGLQLITTLKKNMKPVLIPLRDKLLLRKRFIIETINDQLKNISQIEHSRHRSLKNFMVNLISGLIAYTWQKKKPEIFINPSQLNDLFVA